MEEGIVGLVGVLIGIIGTLITQLLLIIYNKEENKEKLLRETLKEKYKMIKQKTKEYLMTSKNVQNTTYLHFINVGNFEKVSKEKIEKIQELRMHWKVILQQLMDMLEDDNYIMQKLVNFNQIEKIYNELINDIEKMDIHITIWKATQIGDKEQIFKDEQNLIKNMKNFEELIKELDISFQEKLYKSIIKFC